MMTRIIAPSVILVHSLCVSRHRGAETQRNAQRIQKPRRHENTKEGSVTVTGECIDVVGRDVDGSSVSLCLCVENRSRYYGSANAVSVPPEGTRKYCFPSTM